MSRAETLPKSEIHEVTRMTLLNIQVCSKGTEDEALDWLRSASPAGTLTNWQKQEDPDLAPVACSNDHGRKHYIYVC